MITEGNKRLGTAVSKTDMNEIAAAFIFIYRARFHPEKYNKCSRTSCKSFREMKEI